MTGIAKRVISISSPPVKTDITIAKEQKFLVFYIFPSETDAETLYTKDPEIPKGNAYKTP